MAFRGMFREVQVAEVPSNSVITTRYFEEQVLRKRPYIQREWCEAAVTSPDAKVRQVDGRMRFWKFIPALGKFLRVITLEDGSTVHNAFPDRDYRGPA